MNLYTFVNVQGRLLAIYICVHVELVYICIQLKSQNRTVDLYTEYGTFAPVATVCLFRLPSPYAALRAGSFKSIRLLAEPRLLPTPSCVSFLPGSVQVVNKYLLLSGFSWVVLWTNELTLSLLGVRVS